MFFDSKTYFLTKVLPPSGFLGRREHFTPIFAPAVRNFRTAGALVFAMPRGARVVSVKRKSVKLTVNFTLSGKMVMMETSVSQMVE